MLTNVMTKSISIFLSMVFITLNCAAQNVGVNTQSPEASLDVNGDMILRPFTLAVADGTTTALDINTSKFSYYRVEGPTADFTLAGIAAGIDGRQLSLFNRSGFTMQLNNEDATAAPTDMILTGTGADISIPNKAVINLQYDANEGKWIVKSSSKAPVTGSGVSYWDTDGTNIYNNNTGNVGIGTSNPYTRLTIESPYNTSGWFHIGRNGTDSIVLGESIGGVSAGLGTSTQHILRLTSGTLGRIQLIPDGNVIVGDNFVPPFGRFTVRTPNNSWGISHTSDGGNIIATQIGGTSAGIGTFSNTNMRIFSGGLSRIFISEATGNVGIGLTDDNPVFKLDVAGRMRLRTQADGNSAGLWLNNPANTNTIAFMGIADAVTTGFYGNVSGWGLIMNTNTGNVGIGTLNPTYKLSVNGDIRSKEVVVETGWADYVFDDNYKLNSLDEVEKFINKNKHLPGIPPAAEIEKNGLQLGETQKKMMEKIEELTLYVIELKKEIVLLKNIKKQQ